MTTRGWQVLAVVNAAATLAVAVFSVLLFVDPAVGLPEGVAVTEGVTRYAHVSAVRSIALAAVLGYLLVCRSRSRLTAVLVVAGLTQVGDAVLNAVAGVASMVVGATVLAVISLASAWWLSRSACR